MSDTTTVEPELDARLRPAVAACRALPRDESLVVLITVWAGPRVAKVAQALQAAGKRVVLVHKHEPTFSPDFIDECRTFQTPADAVELACSYQPLAFHCFGKWDFLTTALMCFYKPGRVVFDNYDVLNGIVIERPDGFYMQHLPLEKYCMETADGLVCRCLEPQAFRRWQRRQGVTDRVPRLLFLDGCSNSEETLSLPRRLPDEPHIVYIGNINPASVKEEDPFNYHFWLADICRQQRVHYHVYPPLETLTAHLDAFAHYFELDRENPYFHFDRPIPSDMLAQELSRYDFGLLILSRDVKGLANESYTAEKYDVCIGNKVFDYFDAGLPILVHPGRFTSFIAKRYGGAVDVSVDDLLDLRRFLQSLPFGRLRTGAMVSRHQYTVTSQGQRLVAFYESLPAPSVPVPVATA